MVCLLSMVACGPSIAYYGRSPDRIRSVRVLEQSSKQYVEIDGIEQKDYRAVGFEALTFSPDSQRLAYPALGHAGWFVVVDGRRSPAWHGIGEIIFSPDSTRLAYVAERDRRWHVVVGEQQSPPFQAIVRRSLKFSPDGKRLAYVAKHRGRYVVVLDGAVGRSYRAIDRLQFSQDSEHVAFIGWGKGGLSVTFDGAEETSYEEIVELTLGPFSRHGYFGLRDDNWYAVIDDREYGPYASVATLRFSPNGEHFAYVSSETDEDRLVFDGVPGPAFSEIRPKQLCMGRTLPETVFVGKSGSEHWYVVRGTKMGSAYWTVDSLKCGPAPHWAASVQTSSGAHALVNGRLNEPMDAVRDLQMTAGGGIFYIGWWAGRPHVVVEDRTFDVGAVVEGTLIQTNDGRHWACLVADSETRELWVLLDGEKSHAFDLEELAGEILRRGLDNASPRLAPELIRKWLAADLERLRPPLEVSLDRR